MNDDDKYVHVELELLYIIGISVKNWVRECLLSVEGLRMLWFAFGFIMSDALIQDFLSVCA